MADTFKAGEAPWEKKDSGTTQTSGTFQAGQAPWETKQETTVAPFVAPESSYTPSFGVGAVTSTLGGAYEFGKGMVEDVKDDFSKTKNFFTSSMWHPAAEPKQFWSDLGGVAGAVMDVGIVAPMVIGGTAAGPEGTVAGAAGGFAAKEALKTGGKKVLEKIGGTAGVAAESGIKGFAESKAQGATTLEAGVEGAKQATFALGTIWGLNKYGPAVKNKFLDLFSKTKGAEETNKFMQQGVEVLKNASQSKNLGITGAEIDNKINQSTNSIAAATENMFSSFYNALGKVTGIDIEGIKSKAYDKLSTKSNQIMDNYSSTWKLLENPKFALTPEEEKTIKTQIEKFAPPEIKVPSKEEFSKLVDSEESRIVSQKGLTAEQFKSARQLAEKNVNAKLAKEAIAGAGETDLVQATKNLISGKEKLQLSDFRKLLEGIPQEVQEAGIKSTIWKSIREKLSSDTTGEGKTILDMLSSLDVQHAETSAQREFASILDKNISNPETAVSEIFNKLSNEKDVETLFTTLGGRNSEDTKKFTQMLFKKITGEVKDAFTGEIGKTPSGFITPEIYNSAQKEATAVMDKYLEKISSLKTLVPPSWQETLYGMRNSLSDLSTISKNHGVDLSMLESGVKEVLEKRTAAGEKSALQKGVETIKGTELYKAITKGSPEEMPNAFLNANIKELTALKDSLGEGSKEWQTLQASSLGSLLKKATGLWKETDAKAIEDTLTGLSSKLKGDTEKLDLMFGEEGSKFIGDLAEYGKALKEAGKTGVMTKAGLNLVAAAGAKMTGHAFLMISKLREVGKILTEKESSLINDVAEKYAKSPESFVSEIVNKKGDVNKNIQLLIDTLGKVARFATIKEVTK